MARGESVVLGERKSCRSYLGDNGSAVYVTEGHVLFAGHLDINNHRHAHEYRRVLNWHHDTVPGRQVVRKHTTASPDGLRFDYFIWEVDA